MKKLLYKEEELLNSIDHWCNELNKALYNSEQYINALTELNYYKFLLQKVVRKRAKKRAKQ
jgi:hypothetical protein